MSRLMRSCEQEATNRVSRANITCDCWVGSMDESAITRDITSVNSSGLQCQYLTCILISFSNCNSYMLLLALSIFIYCRIYCTQKNFGRGKFW